MGRSGGCCLGANCTAPPCPSGNCCFVEKNDSINIFNQFSLAINHHLDYYNCEDDVTENCCLSKQYSLFNEGVKCGDIRSCDSTSIAIPSVYNTDKAFALLKHNGSVVAWGDSATGGSVPSDLSNVVEIFSNPVAFVALKKDGTAVPWGDSSKGGSFLPTLTPGEDPDTLDNIKSVTGSAGAFVAIKTDGTVIAWGDAAYGGVIPSSIKNLLVDIVEVVSTDRYFAARNTDGEIFIWGNGAKAYDKRDTDKSGSVTVLDALKIINFMDRYGDGVPGGLTLEEFEQWAEENPTVATSIYSSKFDVNRSGTVTALDALLVINGMAVIGGPSYDSGFSNVKKIYSNKHAFAFLLNDGKVFVWGDDIKGGNTGGNHPSLVNIKEIYNTDQAFLAHRQDNKIIVWGDIDTAAGPASDFYSEVLDVFPSRYAFGLSFIKITEEGSNDVLTHKFDVLGSIVPTKENITARRRTNYGAPWNQFNNITIGEIDINSYTVASYEGPYNFKSSLLDVDNNTVTFKRDFYAGYYAFHFVTSTLDDDTSENVDTLGRYEKDTIYFYSIGQTPVDGEKGSHDFEALTTTTGSIVSSHYTQLATNLLYINDNDDPGTPQDNPTWRTLSDGTNLKRHSPQDAKSNNSFVKGGKSYAFNEKATAMLLPISDGVYTLLTGFGFRSLPDDFGNYFLLTNGHIDYGGYQTSFGDHVIPNGFPVDLTTEYNFVALFSNKYAFCGIQFYSSNGADRDTQYEIKTWGVQEFGGSSQGVDFSNTFTLMKNISIKYEGCHPDYCDQELT